MTGPSDDGDRGARTPRPTLGAGHAGQQRADVREGRRLRRRSRVPRPRGRLRPGGQGGRAPDGGRAPSPSSTGAGRYGPSGSTASRRPWCHGDIIEVVTGAREALDVIIVPKARTARDVWWVDVLLTQLETKLGLTKRIGLEVLIEEAEGLANAADIARSSDRLEAIIFGAGDLSASLQARVDGNFDPLGELPRRLLALRPRPGAGRGTGRGHRRHRRALSRLQGPRGLPPGRRARQPAGLRRQVGHPPRPDPHRQRGVRSHRAGDRRGRSSPYAVYRSSEAEGVGAIGRDGKLVDAAHMRLAANVLYKASLAEGTPPAP